MPQLVINASTKNGAATVTVQGDIDSVSAAELRDTLAHLASDHSLVVDLADVPFIDSSGLGALVRASRTAKEGGRTFRIVNAGRAVSRAAQYAGLSEHLGMTSA